MELLVDTQGRVVVLACIRYQEDNLRLRTAVGTRFQVGTLLEYRVAYTLSPVGSLRRVYNNCRKDRMVRMVYNSYHKVDILCSMSRTVDMVVVVHPPTLFGM